MTNAQTIVKIAINHIDPVKQSKQWYFLNRLRMGIVPHAELDSAQTEILTAIVQDVAHDIYADTLENSQQSHVWSMQIATWVNGVHVANQYV